jgi:membrane protein required for colicin V production
MTGFDILVLVVVGFAATFGFLRGFVQEAISLFAGVVAIVAIHFAHAFGAGAHAAYRHRKAGPVFWPFSLLIVPYCW